jgi:hypothetical protein
MQKNPFWHDGGWLGERLELTYELRAALDVRTIKAYDKTPEEMAELKREKARLRAEKRHRAEGRQPRAEYLANSISRTEPWKDAGFKCRRTWERKGKPTRVASVSGTYSFSKATDIPATRTSPPRGKASSRNRTDSGFGQFGTVSFPNTFWKRIDTLPELPGFRVVVPISPLRMAA